MKKLIMILALLMLGSIVSADDWDKEKKSEPEEEFGNQREDFKPFSVLEVGLSYRTDANQYYNKEVGIKAKLITRFTPAMAAIVGVGYYPGFEEEFNYARDPENIKEIQYELGFRFSAYELDLQPYIEISYEYHRYDGAGSYPTISKSGLGLGAGMEYYLNKKILLGLTIQHVFNNNEYTDYILTDSPPWPDDNFVPYNNYLPEKVYNPTTLSLMIGLKL